MREKTYPVFLNPSQITALTTSAAPSTCEGAMDCPKIHHASTKAKIGSTFMIAE
jgi:hypothetical protein